MLTPALDKRTRLPDDEGQFLGEAVVQVARDPPSLAGGRCLRQLLLPGGDLARSSDRQHQIEAEPEDVAGVDPAREERREQEVVGRRRGGERRRKREPAEELV